LYQNVFNGTKFKGFSVEIFLTWGGRNAGGTPTLKYILLRW